MSWSESEKLELIRLARTGKYQWKEIAEQMGRKPSSVSFMARRLNLKQHPKLRSRLGQWNNKHKHLRGPVMKYFVTHTLEQTRKHFRLTQSEIKSIFTIGYRDPKFAHLRKDGRPHTAWSDKDWVFMVRHSGIMPREWIARKLKRGTTYNSVKDALAKFKGLGKYMNGMPVGWAENIITPEGDIKTKAGPTGGDRADFRYRLIPWVELEKLIKGKGMKPEIRTAIKAMARFQRWIHGGKTSESLIRTIHSMLRKENV